MAKMHSRARGHAQSNKPLRPQTPTWIRYKPKEIEMLIGKFAKEGKTSSEIGIVLRDSYGIPSVKLLVGKRIQGILGDKKLLHDLPEDLVALIKRSVQIRKHLDINRKDMAALRGLQFTESKIKRLAKYYKGGARIPVDWKYDPSLVKIYTQ